MTFDICFFWKFEENHLLYLLFYCFCRPYVFIGNVETDCSATQHSTNHQFVLMPNFWQVSSCILRTCLITGQNEGASRETKCTKISHGIQYSSVQCDITGLIKGKICSVSSSCFSIQAPRSDLTREGMVSDPKQSSCYTSSVVRSVGH